MGLLFFFFKSTLQKCHNMYQFKFKIYFLKKHILRKLSCQCKQCGYTYRFAVCLFFRVINWMLRWFLMVFRRRRLKLEPKQVARSRCCSGSQLVLPPSTSSLLHFAPLLYFPLLCVLWLVCALVRLCVAEPVQASCNMHMRLDSVVMMPTMFWPGADGGSCGWSWSSEQAGAHHCRPWGSHCTEHRTCPPAALQHRGGAIFVGCG